MHSIISNIQQAEDFVKNLKRSDNWVSNDELIAKLKASYDLIQTNEREDLVPITCVHIALYYIDLGEYGEAWHYTETAKLKAEEQKNYDSLLNAISLQYRIQRYLGNLDVAQELVNLQIEIALDYNNNEQLYSAYLNQACQYHLQNLKEECLIAFEKVLHYCILNNDKYYISMTYNAYSSVLIEFKDFKKAEENLIKGYDIAINNSYYNILALANSNFGLLNEKKKQYKSAISYYQTSIFQFNQLKNSNEANQAKLELARNYLKIKNYKETEKTLKQIQRFSEKNKIKSNLNDVYYLFSELSEEQNDYKKSLSFYKKYKSINEEIFNSETDKRIKNLEIIQKNNILYVEKMNAEKMATIKHDFLANMSHEIRTPINSILGICYLLQQRQLDEMSFNYVNRLKRSGENLLGIINDVLDISKIESGKMELIIQPFLLETLIDDVFNSLEPKAIEKNIKLNLYKSYPLNTQLNGDVVRLQQVLTNLLANAIKFTQDGSVMLKIENHKSAIRFKIIDTGIGIPNDKIEKIFERYEQAAATIKTTFGGTGLGLSISKKIIELMDGTIDIKSKLGKGTQFIITIPFLNASQQVTETIKKAINPELLNHKHILIADDNMENRMVAKEVLHYFNKTVVIYEAENGKEVLDILYKQQMDILFLDLDMPILNGFETLQKIRKNKKHDALKIIGNTASLSTMTKDELLELGFNDFIYKPYKPEEFIRSICK